MYKCLNCGEVFDHPNLAEDFTSEYFGQRVHHFISLCPNCGGEDLDTAYQCRLCGEYHSNDSDYCSSCEDIIHEYMDPETENIARTFGFDKDKVREAVKEII